MALSTELKSFAKKRKLSIAKLADRLGQNLHTLRGWVYSGHDPVKERADAVRAKMREIESAERLLAK